MRGFKAALAVVVSALALGGAQVRASYYAPAPSDIDPKTFQIDELKILGTRLDRDFAMVGEDGNRFTLGDKLGRPMILVLSYYKCDGVCGVINEHLLDLVMAMDAGAGGLVPGRDFDILTLSFDRHDTPETLAEFRKRLPLVGDLERAWTFALAADGDAIRPFADALDYRFFWSPPDRTFFHPDAYVFLSPEGRVVRVLYALANAPTDLRLALLDARQGQFRPSEIISYAVSLCYSYNFKEGRYTYNIPLFVAVGSLSLGIGALSASLLAFAGRRKKARQEKESRP